MVGMIDMDLSDLDLDKITVSDDYIASRDYVIFDKEFIEFTQKLRDVFSDLNSIFKRWSRFDKVAISKSVFDYESKVIHMYRFCDRFYTFHLGDLEISIFRYQKRFAVRVDFGDQDCFDMYFSLLNTNCPLYNRSQKGFIFHSDEYDDFKDCVSDYLRLVGSVISFTHPFVLGGLF